MHELLMKVTGMRLKSDFLAKVFVLWSMGNELVPSPLSIPPATLAGSQHLLFTPKIYQAHSYFVEGHLAII